MKRILLALTTAFTLSSAQAELVHGDWQTAGDNKVTIDTATGIEWLKLKNTQGMSINAVLSELDTGGQFAGWRLPTSDEVQNLVETILPEFSWNEGETSYSSVSYSGYSNRWQEWMSTIRYSLVGNGSANDRYWWSYGLHVEDDGSVKMSGTYRRQKYTWGDYAHWATLYEDFSSTDYTLDYVNSNYGVFLVSDGGVTLSSQENPALNEENPNSPYNVSAPGMALSFGALGMLAWRRRQI